MAMKSTDKEKIQPVYPDVRDMPVAVQPFIFRKLRGIGESIVRDLTLGLF